jgi:hypothetical protein
MATVIYQVLQKPIEERLIDAACIYWEVDREYFKTPWPDGLVAYRKGVIYWLIKHNTSLTLNLIGAKFGFSTHGPVARLIENIDAQKNVLKHICNDINQISHLADKLDAEFITTSVCLINNKIQKSE